jgi:hypothetical protein
VRGFQWAPSDADVFLVVIHHFDGPVTLTSVAFTEPDVTAPGKTATATLTTATRDFYTYIQRTDGNAFVQGTYSVTMQVQTVAGIAGDGESEPRRVAHLYGAHLQAENKLVGSIPCTYGPPAPSFVRDETSDLFASCRERHCAVGLRSSDHA